MDHVDGAIHTYIDKIFHKGTLNIELPEFQWNFYSKNIFLLCKEFIKIFLQKLVVKMSLSLHRF
jgi:hypothetical protein